MALTNSILTLNVCLLVLQLCTTCIVLLISAEQHVIQKTYTKL